MIERYVDTEELKRLLSTLMAVLGGLVIAGLFASLVVPGLRNANKPGIRSMPGYVENETGWADPTEAPPQRGRVIPPVDPQTLIASSPELIDLGKALFEKHCVACHGQLGNGNGPSAAGLKPPPRNMTNPDGWANGYDMPGIFKTLNEGISGTAMNPFDYLSKKDRMALVHYVQTLGGFSHNAEDAQAMEDLAEKLASAGERIPNRIPVSLAMTRLEEEFSAPPPLAVGREDRSPGATILRRVIVNPTRAAQVLVQSRTWRTSDRELAASILPDVPGNGFSISTATLNPSEWRLLYTELLTRLAP